jgi:flagellar motor switch protein FliN
MSENMVVQGEAGWGLLAQIPLRLSVEIGSVSRTMQDLLDLAQGAVIELDRPIDEPVDILANGTVIARGEVVNAGEHYGVRITEVVDAERGAPRKERRQ